MNEIFIKAIEAEEAAGIETMARRIWPKAYRDIISQEQIDYMLGWMYAPKAISREIEEDDVRYFWIVNDREKVGFLAAGPVVSGQRAFLHKCYVLPEEHGRGIGSRALALLKNLLRDAGVPVIELRVNRHNTAAISFYEKNGFRTVATDVADIGGGYEMDDFIMRRTL